MAEDKFVSAHAPSDTAIPLVKNIFGVSADFLGELKTWLEQNPPTIPISQIVGFEQFTAKGDQITTEESTASNTFTDLTTVGPSLTGLADGSYIVLFGASLQAVGGNIFQMGISINSDAVDGNHICETATTTNLSLAHGQLLTLSGGGNNSIVAKYRMNTGASAGHARYRWLIALRYSN